MDSKVMQLTSQPKERTKTECPEEKLYKKKSTKRCMEVCCMPWFTQKNPINQGHCKPRNYHLKLKQKINQNPLKQNLKIRAKVKVFKSGRQIKDLATRSLTLGHRVGIEADVCVESRTGLLKLTTGHIESPCWVHVHGLALMWENIRGTITDFTGMC